MWCGCFFDELRVREVLVIAAGRVSGDCSVVIASCVCEFHGLLRSTRVVRVLWGCFLFCFFFFATANYIYTTRKVSLGIGRFFLHDIQNTSEFLVYLSVSNNR